MKKSILSMVTAITVAGAFAPAHAQDDLVYVAVEPCRIADTRIASEGFIKANTNRDFRVAGSSDLLAAQGGEVDCLNPKAQKPVAIAAYILAVPTDSSSGKGVLSAYPSDLPPPPIGSGSTVNFAKDQVIGNTTIVTVCDSNSCPAGGELAVLARNTDEHVIIDVQGYFYPNHAVVSFERVLESVILGAEGTTADMTLTCPDDKWAISGGYSSGNANAIEVSRMGQAGSTPRNSWLFTYRVVNNLSLIDSAIFSVYCVSSDLVI